MTQMTIDDLLNQPGHLPVRDPNKVYAPFELYGMGIKWTMEDERLWQKEVWKIYNREWAKKNYINWFQAIDIYIAERDAT
ncbi:hypothetical protein [Aneurinibacillus thermoaerophilus]|jgi:hypothetical protein|uniref:hypothetical protein n=1 Tax=Aneurinibacillus thermoaerophilus TaxID=143495 RepID=UPI002E24EC64|nr:hypothetical protein [Aneurinibacillus thermoaerophilus]